MAATTTSRQLMAFWTQTGHGERATVPDWPWASVETSGMKDYGTWNQYED